MNRDPSRKKQLAALFPGFAATGRAIPSLLRSDLMVLVTTFFLQMVGVLALGLFGALLDRDSLWLLEYWTLISMALAGAWSTLGSGKWHFRFPLAVFAALWFLVAYVAAVDAWQGKSAVDAELIAAALLSFGLAAFGAVWIRSIGGVEYRRPGVAAAQSPLRRGQFNLATLMAGMLLVAMTAALFQTPSTLWNGIEEALSADLDDEENWLIAGLIVASMFAALGAMRWRFSAAILLIAAALALGVHNGPVELLQLRYGRWRALDWIAEWLTAGVVASSLAAFVLNGLRLLGFQLMRSPAE
jgi:hypothetical protein